MKKHIFLYLFLFAALYIVFQYMNAKKAYAHMDELETNVENLQLKKNQLTSKIEDLEKTIGTLKQENRNLNYFSLSENAAASSYFAKLGFDKETIAARIKGEIMDQNKAGQDNKLVPFSGMVGPMRVNHIEFLNHRWLIADFTDGTYWGEMLLKFDVDADGTIAFTTIESFLYPGRR